MTDFMEKDEPNFIFKNINALTDMGCIIEKELPDIKAQPNIEEITILGRSGSLTEWHGDYKPYDLDVGTISIPYNNLEEVKRWLSGNGKLITHNDIDKVIDAVPSFTAQTNFENEWGVFYTFSLSFHCQPLKHKAIELPILLNSKNVVFNPGSEKSSPYLKVETSGGEFTITCNDTKITVIGLSNGTASIDCDKGFVIQDGKQLRTIGEWPEVVPGKNEIAINGNYSYAEILLRSAWT